VVWWCPVRRSLNLLAFYPLNTIYTDDRSYRIIRAPEELVEEREREREEFISFESFLGRYVGFIGCILRGLLSKGVLCKTSYVDISQGGSYI